MLPKLIHLKQIRVAAVSYLNTKPLLYGLRKHPIAAQLSLIEDYPASIARMLLNDEVDLALVPVAMIPLLPGARMVTEVCIGAEGPVASVGIFSECPMEAIESVYLDYQSRTSVNLARILLRDYWRREVRIINAAGEDFREKLSGTTAGVVIGDRALQQRLHSPFCFDLAEAWINYTSLPFVFAAWVSNKPLPSNFETAFNEANLSGLQHLPEVIAENPYPVYDLHRYFTQNISYELTVNKRKGLALFLEKLKGL